MRTLLCDSMASITFQKYLLGLVVPEPCSEMSLAPTSGTANTNNSAHIVFIRPPPR